MINIRSIGAIVDDSSCEQIMHFMEANSVTYIPTRVNLGLRHHPHLWDRTVRRFRADPTTVWGESCDINMDLYPNDSS